MWNRPSADALMKFGFGLSRALVCGKRFSKSASLMPNRASDCEVKL
jgi:hypothetical protein